MFSFIFLTLVLPISPASLLLPLTIFADHYLSEHAGKIIPHETVAKFEERLRKELDVDVLTPDHTRGLYEAYERQTKIVDAMCGEY